MDLSNRMLAIAKLVTKGNRVCDVACDHGYVPIYLVEIGVCPSAIAMDINEGPLLGAQNHINEKNLSSKIITRLSDGLDALEVNETDSLVLAGIGGKLAIRILERGSLIVKEMSEIIIQPQSEVEDVRQYLRENYFSINQEDMVFEDGKYYQIIRAVPKQENISNETNSISSLYLDITSTGLPFEAENRFGTILLKKHHPVLTQFLKKRREKWRDLYQEVLKQDARFEVQCKIKKELDLLDLVCDYLGEES